jgi:hypothetical protein
MSITTRPQDREHGIIWLDPALADMPATHVLVVGVGRFANELPPLNSTPASARALAAWYVDGAKGQAGGFANPDCPLGSVAILLSERDDGAPSEVEGATVPRATLPHVKDALRAWVDRAERNADSSAILAIFSHGQAERRRTAVLFEDYGSDELDPYAGMTEAEQLVDALSTLAPRDKLVVFDFCRTKVDLDLPHQGTFGTPLIGGRRGAIPRRPQVMMSTQYDGEGYGGKGGRPTLFATALLDALRGCAADSNDWTVNSRRLGEITQRILGLWRDGDEPIQVPDTQDNEAFVVAYVPQDDRMTLFLTLDSEHDITRARLTVSSAGQTVFDQQGPGGPDPFARFPLAADKEYLLVAAKPDGTIIGQETRKLRPPVAFRKLPPDPLPPLVRTERAKGLAAPGDATVRVASDAGSAVPAVVTVSRIVRPAGAVPDGPDEIHLGPGRDAPTSLSPGTWSVDLRRPGLPPVVHRLQVAPGDALSVDVPAVASAHEWLWNATVAGVVEPGLQRSEGPGVPVPEVEDEGKPLGVTVTAVQSDARFTLFDVSDQAGSRFRRDGAGDNDQPVWIRMRGIDAHGRSWRERAFLPVQGLDATYVRGWSVGLLADSAPARRRSHLAAYVVADGWGPMLAFLAKREFHPACCALKLMELPFLEAIEERAQNPLAAICGALVALATNRSNDLGIPEDWLRKLCDRFPTLPDGAVILARHRLHGGHDAVDLLETALARGVPVTSLAVDWLAEALAMTGHPRASEARETAMSCDPGRVFTVLHLDPEAP